LSRFASSQILVFASALSSVLLLAAPVLADAVPAVPQSMTAASEQPATPTDGTQPHAGYPTTREKWRYCPRDGSHQCVELDIPGVTEPDQAPGAPATIAQ
jgi:hypothetical protein